ncbi:MAG: hypothetical protein QXU95_01005 [Candidatus Bathyarchaeia archaeon]|nr:hypothetical protein [Candidatus Bathyarchaeota archaeon]
MRFINLQPQLAVTWFKSPEIKEEFILNLKLLKAGMARRFPHSIDISKILSDIRSRSDEAGRFLYKKTPISQAVESITESPQISSVRRIYTIYPKLAGAISYKYASIIPLRASMPSGAPKISSVTLQKLYEIETLEAVSPLKSFDEKRLRYYFRALWAVSKTYREMESSMEEMSETATRKTQPIIEGMKETYRPIIQRPSPAFIRTHISAQRIKDALSIHEAQIKRMVYSHAFLFEPAFFINLIETVNLLTQKTWRGVVYDLSRIFVRNLSLLPYLHWEEPLKAGETGKPSVLLAHERVFFEVPMYPLTRQLPHSKVEYFRSAAEFFGKLIASSSTVPLTEQRIKSLVGEGFKKYSVEFKVTRRYAETISEVLPHLMDYHPIVGRFKPKIKPIVPQPMKLMDYAGLMKKPLDVVYPSISSVKAIFGRILLKFDLERLIMRISEGLTAHIYSAISKPLFEVSYGGEATFFQSLRIHEVASILQMLSSAPPPSSEAVKVQRPINVTVRVESPADEGDLRELERKIVKILREEARRHGLNI